MYAKIAVFFLAAMAVASPPEVILRRGWPEPNGPQASGCGNGQVQACCNGAGEGGLIGPLLQCLQVPVIAGAIGQCAVGNTAACCNTPQSGLLDLSTCSPLLNL